MKKKSALKLALGATLLFLLSTVCLQPPAAFAQGTAFTYQGRLNDGAGPANGSYDVRFAIYDSSNTPGTLVAGPLTATTGVSNGLFTLTLDFGAGVFTGPDRWLDIGVRTNGAGVFATLNPRQKLAATPYAVTAGNVTGAVAAGQLTGSVPLANLPTALLVTNGQASVNLAGTFSGNGNGVTNVLLTRLNSQGAVTSFFSISFQFSFASSPTSQVVSTGFVLADVNGDNRQDLVCAEQVNVAVLTNDGNGNFSLANTYLVGNDPIDVAAEDVNGDGRVDLISVNYLDNTVSVLTNRGNGTFALAGTPAVGVGPNAIAVTDVNGDGRPDLITANYGVTDTNSLGTGTTLTVLTNAGNARFLLASSPDVGAASFYVVAVDANGDGWMDLVSLDSDVEKLVVLTNTTHGTFVPASTNTVSGGSYVVVGDVNGDGKKDLLVSSYNGVVLVLTNGGGGTFALAGTPASGLNSISVAAADVNNDGWLDLVCSSYSSGTLTTLTNDGTGAFFPAATDAAGTKPYIVKAADLNGDGFVDLVSSRLSTNRFTVLTNNPHGQIIQFNGAFTGDGSGLTNFHINASNLTSGTLGDARLSANVALLNANQAFTGQNNFNNAGNSFTGDGSGLTGLSASHISNGTLADARLSANAPLLNANQAFTGQNNFNNAGNSFTGDGSGLTGLNASHISSGALSLAQLPATLVTNGASGVNLNGSFSGNGAEVTNVQLVNLNSGGTISWPGIFTLAASPATGAFPYDIVPVDINGDGKMDLAVANLNSNTLSVLTNNGAGGFASAASVSGVGDSRTVAAADINGDGKVDLIGAYFSNDQLVILTNNGAGGFTLSSTPSVDVDVDAAVGPWSVTAADVNGDGKMDLISANLNGYTLSVLTNNGSGGFTLAATLSTGQYPFYVIAADVNGDHKMDLISANYGSHSLSVWTNNGSGGFMPAPWPNVGTSPISVVATDVNGDGKMDLISANYGSGTLSVLTNNGTGVFTLASSPAVDSPVSVTAADVNGDGRMDLISASSPGGLFGGGTGNTLTVLTNNGAGVFGVISSPVVGLGPHAVVAVDVNGDGKVDLLSANSVDNTVSVLFNSPAYSGNFYGNLYGSLYGSVPLVTNINAGSITTGTLADARLSANVPLLNANQTFSGVNSFNNIFNSFTGNGSGLTALNANNISSGTLADARLSSNAALRAGGNTFTNTQTFNGAINLNSAGGFDQSSLGSFSIDSAGVPGGRLVVQSGGNVGVNTTTPQAQLNVNGTARVDASPVAYSEGLSLNLPTDMTGGGYGGITFHNAARGGAYGSTTIKWGMYYNYTPEGGGSIAGKGFAIFQDNLNTRFYIATNGNVGIGTTTPTNKLQVVTAYCTGTSWVNNSDRNLKQDFAAVDAVDVVDKIAAMPIGSWSYKSQPGEKHIGPMAQDFHAAFGLGDSDRAISTVDEGGVALAAIQGLNEKLEAKSQKLETENAELKARLEKLERFVNSRDDTKN